MTTAGISMATSPTSAPKKDPRRTKALQIVRLHAQRKNVALIAEMLDCTPLHVFNVLRRAGKWPDGHLRRPLRGLEATIRRQYLSGKTLAQLALRYRVSRVGIFKAIRRAEAQLADKAPR